MLGDRENSVTYEIKHKNLVDIRGITHRIDQPITFVSWTLCGRGYDSCVQHQLVENREVDCMACIAAGCKT